MTWTIRPATHDDIPTLIPLIESSARALCAIDYTPEQIEGALRGAFGVDTQLIDDGTYYAIEQGGAIVACGGWSYRKTLFGGDARSERDAGELDPTTDAAKIRAFFVDPKAARQGLGRALLDHCEQAAHDRGFHRLELMGTLTGVRLYERFGYVASESIQYPLEEGLTIEFVPMTKTVTTKTVTTNRRAD